MERDERFDLVLAPDVAYDEPLRQLRRGDGLVEWADHIQRAQRLDHKAVPFQQRDALGVIVTATRIERNGFTVLPPGASDALHTPGDHLRLDSVAGCLRRDLKPQVVARIHEGKAHQLAIGIFPQARVCLYGRPTQQFP